MKNHIRFGSLAAVCVLATAVFGGAMRSGGSRRRDCGTLAADCWPHSAGCSPEVLERAERAGRDAPWRVARAGGAFPGVGPACGCHPRREPRICRSQAVRAVGLDEDVPQPVALQVRGIAPCRRGGRACHEEGDGGNLVCHAGCGRD